MRIWFIGRVRRARLQAHLLGTDSVVSTAARIDDYAGAVVVVRDFAESVVQAEKPPRRPEGT